MASPRLSELPIDEILPQVRESLRAHRNLVLVAAPGAGKTTRIPQIFLQSNENTISHGQTLLLQPRRIAVRSSARRIAWETGVTLGEEVGFQVRFENQSSARTRLKVITEGILTRQLQSDPTLAGVGTVILDEFHERSLHTDLALALLRELQQSLREDLRIIVMSATLDAASVAQFLGDCPIIESAGRAFPVQVSYRPRSSVWSDTRTLEDDVLAAVLGLTTAADDDGGHVIVFLPGTGEIARVERRLASVAVAKQWAVLPLHGSLSSDEQDRVLGPLLAPFTRKIILATNIAETSLTIDGVNGVVDSGLARVMRCDPKFGLERLELARISAASSTQRAGRAGRQRPGRCVRLWSAHEQAQLREFEAPEIARVDLTATCLALAEWGVSDFANFGWFEAPPAAQLDSALALLRRLRAIDSDGRISTTGRDILGFPVHPRLGRLLALATSSRDPAHWQEAASIAALLSERDVLKPRDESAHASGESDLDERLDLLRRGAARSIAMVRDALVSLVRAQSGVRRPEANFSWDAVDALCLSFPDRVTRRRAAGSPKGVMVGGRGITLAAASVVRDAPLFLSLDPQEQRRDGKLEAQTNLAVQISVDRLRRLFPDRVEERTEARLDEARGTATGWRALYFEDLALTDPVPVALAAGQKQELMRESLLRAPRSFFAEDEGAAAWLRRYEFLRRWLPELEWPELSDSFLTQVLSALLDEGTMANMSSAAKVEALEQHLDYKIRQLLREEAPESLVVPSGSRIRLQYDAQGEVSMAVRLQEIFGWTETPRLARGRAPVGLELLGPNFRPVQITRDLVSFWSRGYPEVRKELRAKYPRHSWPDNPLTAKPEAKGRRRN
ncbi:MAG: ATP-dependent helicase HrpB [Bdellovibrionales bacterium]|nr:ATP-dependent helicase HrpB [Bdellovibrionales bacterium]